MKQALVALAVPLLLAASLYASTPPDTAEAFAGDVRVRLTHVDAGKQMSRRELIRRAMQRSKARAAALSVARSGGGRVAGKSAQQEGQQQPGVPVRPSGDLEYLIDLAIGTPPQPVSALLDTGSDLNWLQCAPCLDCFEQSGPVFDPAASTSYRNVTCGDARCGLVSPPETAAPRECRRPRTDPCPYYYWYGDQSNTTGDLALEAFTVNLTGAAGTRRVDGVAFGCGHRNRGLFHGAAGLLGLGRGPLSFASQRRGVYGGHAFSYCLVEHGSAAGSKIIFGHDDALLAHPRLNYTAFAPAAADTFYYVQLKSVLVGGEAVPERCHYLAATAGQHLLEPRGQLPERDPARHGEDAGLASDVPDRAVRAAGREAAAVAAHHPQAPLGRPGGATAGRSWCCCRRHRLVGESASRVGNRGDERCSA